MRRGHLAVRSFCFSTDDYVIIKLHIWFKQYLFFQAIYRCIFIVQKAPTVQRTLHKLLPWYWNSLYYGLISLRKMQRFAVANATHTYQFFEPPGTHYCWLARGNVNSKLANAPIHDRCARNRTPDLFR